MNRRLLANLVLGFLAALAAGCTAAADKPPKNVKLEISWASEDARVPPFSRVLLAPIELEFRPVEPMSGPNSLGTGRSEFPVTDRDRERLAQDFNDLLRSELAESKSVTVTDTAGPDVLVLKPALRDIVWRVPPEEPAGAKVYLDTVADLTLTVDFVDGESGKTLGSAADRRTAEPANTTGDFGALRGSRVEATAELRRLARKWGTRLRGRVEQLYFASKPR